MKVHTLFRSALRAAVLLLCVAALSGCLSMKSYVDPTLPIVAKADVPVPATKRPLLVLFEFRTGGKPNASATAQIRPRIVTVASESGLFSGVTANATDGTEGGRLTIVIDNVADTKNAAGKGFGTGLTLGAVGSMVTDGYICTATYTREGKSTTVSLKHALHTTIGNHSGPPGLTPVTPQEGVFQIMDQLAWNTLKQLAEQKAFD